MPTSSAARKTAKSDGAKPAGSKTPAAPDPASAKARAKEILDRLRLLGSEENRQGQARFGINIDEAFGVSMAVLRPMAKRYGRDHELAAALWDSGYHEARILAGLIDDPGLVTPGQMDEWAAQFNSWDLCDQVCGMFTRTGFAEAKIPEWAGDKREFVRRAGFALLAEYAVHAKKVPDSRFRRFLPLIERHAGDERNFVRKAVNWALRQIGKRSPALHGPALAVCDRLAASDDKTARWIGRDAARELRDPKVLQKLQRMG